MTIKEKIQEALHDQTPIDIEGEHGSFFHIYVKKHGISVYRWSAYGLILELKISKKYLIELGKHYDTNNRD